MQNIIFFNNAFIPRQNAALSVDDRGFLLGDGVYDVVRFYKTEFLAFDAHVKRFKRSMSEIRISLDPFPDLLSIANRLIEVNNLLGKDAIVYFQLTRGAAPRSHTFPSKDTLPTLFASVSHFTPYEKQMQEGIKVITADDIRWQRCDIKAITLLPNTLSFQQAIEHDAFECLFVRNGFVTEASHSNVFGVKNGVVNTHPANNHILHGITREIVIKLCKEMNIEIREEAINVCELFSLDELMVTGTGSEIMPVVKIDNRLLADGLPGPITRKLQTAFNQYKIIV